MAAGCNPAAGRRRIAAWQLATLLLTLWLPLPGPAAEAALSGVPVPAATAAYPDPIESSTRLPDPARLRYDVTAQMKGLQYHAGADLFWQHDRQHYQLRFEFRLLSVLLRSQTSSGAVGQEGLRPQTFIDRVRSKERRATFDRQRGQVAFSADGAPDMALEAGAQDRLSIIFQLAALVAGDPATFQPGRKLAIQTVGPTDAQTWHFTVAPAQKLRYQGEPLPTIKLMRDLRDPKDQQVEVWFAPSLGYLPVQLRITQQDGDSIEQHLTAVDPPG